MTWVSAISWLTAAWLIACGWRAAWDLSRGERHSALFLVLVHLLFCGVPLLLDVTVGQPSYGVFSGFYIASQDPATVLIYSAYIAFVPVVLYRFGRTPPRPLGRVQRTTTHSQHVSKGRSRRLNGLLWVATVAPVVAAVTSPQPQFYLSYGFVATQVLGDLEQYHAFVSALCMVAVASGIGILLTTRSFSKRLCFMLLPWLTAACWLFGKRLIVAFIVLGFVYVWWYRDLLRGRRFVVALVTGAMLIAVGSYGYQRVLRQTNAKEFDAYYTGLRVDFGRDTSIRQAIYAELGDQSDMILEHRGQSVLFNAVMYVPRTVWPSKPWPYAVYQTARALSLSRATPIGWGVTTSWLDEAIANFGWSGILIAPFSLAFLCRLGDQTADPLTRYVTVSVGTLLMTVQLAAFAPLALIWLMLCVWQYRLSRWGLRRARFHPTLQQDALTTGR
jgi:hypothetical protein